MKIALTIIVLLFLVFELVNVAILYRRLRFVRGWEAPDRKEKFKLIRAFSVGTLRLIAYYAAKLSVAPFEFGVYTHLVRLDPGIAFERAKRYRETGLDNLLLISYVINHKLTFRQALDAQKQARDLEAEVAKYLKHGEQSDKGRGDA